jgi:imidazole glycerol phosphate synthase glutamine amidotransferase subunit
VIALVDYGAGNLRSVERALARAGVPSRRAVRPADLEGAAGVVLPGVGAAAPAMRALREQALIAPLTDPDGPPFLGICLGLQLLARSSEEGEEPVPCLGVIPGRVRRFGPGPRVPHTGWNDLVPGRRDPLLRDVPLGTDLFFNHAYRLECPEAFVVALADHGGPFPAVVRRGRWAGVQFHPEKSGAAGLRVLAAFWASCREAAPC